ncbi:MAG: NADH-quinone oxidoreductase subunit G, partial [Actinobacteria bacterium]|nr:NADH-quinone oxidoreductase subunit G [Actinomycetota bacterium]
KVAKATGARIGWIPRRAGERGALDMGLLPIGGRNVEDIIAATGDDLTGLVIAGVQADDLMADLEGAIERADFVVSLETRHTEVTALADVVLPVAAVTEKAGTLRNWEGRDRSFTAVAPKQGIMSDAEVLGELASAMNSELELNSDFWATASKPELSGTPVGAPVLEAGQVELSSWRHLLDNGSLQEGEPYLAATARVPVIRVSPNTAKQLGLTDGVSATVECASVTATAQVIITSEMVDGVVWLPANSADCSLNLPSGLVVNVTAGGNA